MAKRPEPHPILLTTRLRLRQFRAEDTDAMHECFADPEAMRFWNAPVHTKRTETECTVLRYVACTPSYHRHWAVADIETDRCLGLVSYHDGHIRNKRAAIGYFINPAYQSRGMATEAVSAMLDFCFDDLGLHRLQAFIDPNNTPSRKLVEKLGFGREGLLRDHLCVGGIWRDEILYALLRTGRSSSAAVPALIP
ncbi:N-acetyltransferase [Mesorhizobium sp. M1A.F.Ca.ET.072.01.1.1]|uniref:GNAT family N-acetyltransferase n=1 Tax=Mesorhizobium sp. M1A.F.Ca.ET.072.01.1.1 TaxID=2496753 RepID=UPI000FD35ED4|nr:GNAT family protein [Mesorhizobium sp. M1A.F.Ca.ET.072.01.1.1]RUW48270.1 N-acetyltransferase [Mesorhizobium sp. M1A.F.Ca.ET.072.01.1.1]TIU95754.1 MAG: GNAT family N-acetyltransferase [Mesorhizobium sp.]